MKLAELIRFEEGYSDVPYVCSEGYVTIGYGTKLHKAKGMAPSNFPLVVNTDIAEQLLHIEVETKVARLLNSSAGRTYTNLSEDRQAIILSMSYQMGVSGVLAFRNMWAALDIGDYHKAGFEMLDSKWASKDTPTRALRHSSVMVAGTFRGTYE